MNFLDMLNSFDMGDFDMSSFGDWGSMAGGGSTGGWDYWIKAIQDGVIGQSAGFDTVKQNEEGSPLAMEARGEKPEDALKRGQTKGEYVYNLENDAPFLADLYKGFTGDQGEDPLSTKGSTGMTQQGQNNASGSNAALDKSLNEDARKIAGISEGGATPQLNAGDTSFNSMMDAFGAMELPLDNPKSRKELLGEGKKDNKGSKGLDLTGLANANTEKPDASNVQGEQIDPSMFSDLSNMDWLKWLQMGG